MSTRVEEPPLASDDALEKSPQAKPPESVDFPNEKAKSSTQPDLEVTALDEDEKEITLNDSRSDFYTKYRPFILGFLAALILAWWISATVLPETRHRW